MHSLEQLNDYSNLAIEHGDERTYQIINITNSGNNSVITWPGVSYNHPASIGNLNIISSPNTTTYSLNFPSYAVVEPTVGWVSTPNVTTSSSLGTYTAANVAGNVRYESIKSPLVTFNNYSYSGNTSCVTTYNDNQGNSYSYTTSIWVKPNITIDTAYNYSEDILVSMPFTVASQDAQDANTIYYLDFTQITPTGSTSSERGRFIVNGTPGAYTGNVSISGTKNVINAIPITYDPPFDYTGTIVINLNVSKKISGVTSYSFNKTLTLTNTVTNTEYTKPSSLSVTVLTSVSLSSFQITDMPDTGSTSLPNRNYILSLTRYGNVAGTFSNGDSTTISFTGTKSSINSALTAATFTSSSTITNLGTININLTRTTDSKILASNVATTLTSVDPGFGQSWQGGLYFGKINSSNGSGTNPDYRLVVAPKSTYDYQDLRPFVSYLDPITSPAATSNSDGFSATSYFIGLGFTGGSATGYTWNYSNAGYTDWYLPSINELNLLKSNLSSQLWRGSNHYSSTFNAGLKSYSWDFTSGAWNLFNWDWANLIYPHTNGNEPESVARPIRRIAI